MNVAIEELNSFKDDNGITIGHDAEVFLLNKEGDSVTAIDKVGGSKTKPMLTKSGNFLQEDGVAAELNIKPAHSLEEFMGNTILVMDDLLEIIKPLELSIDIKASTTFREEFLKDDRALLAGCEEDYDAYEEAVNMPPQYEGALRAAGGHIHLGWKGGGEDIDAILDTVKSVDYHIVLPSLLLDGDTKRRELYGRAGAFRPKDYGVEVRSPSNFWLKSKDLMRWAYYAAINSIRERGKLPISDNELRDIINSNNVKRAKEVILDCGITMPRGVEYVL